MSNPTLQNPTDETSKTSVTSMWKYFLTYIEYLKSEHPNEDIDFEKELKYDACELSRFLTQFGSLKTEMLICNAQKYYSKNKQQFTRDCISVLEEKKNNPEISSPHEYSFHKESFRRQIIIDLIDATTDVETPSKTKGLNTITQLSNDFYSLNELYETHIRNSSIQILVALGDFLKKFNLLERLGNDFRHKLAYPHTMGELAYPIANDSNDCISLNSLFTEECLKKLKTPQLLALSAFWLNKTAKILKDLNHLIFIVNKTNLWENAISGKKHVNINQENTQLLLHRSETFISLEHSIFDTISCKYLEDQSLSNDDIDEIFTEELDKKIDEYQLLKRLDYTEEEELKSDMSSLHELINAQYLVYELKNLFMYDLLMGCIDEHYSKNWGFAKDKTEHPHYIGLNMDIEGLNMPLRLHIHEEKLAHFLTAYTDFPIIPLYKGQEDTEIIKTPILAPICKRQINFIKEKTKQTPNLSHAALNYIRHIQFLANAKKLPISLKNENLNAPNAINVETREELHIESKSMFKD